MSFNIPSGTYSVGDIIDVNVIFSSPVKVTNGLPTLSLQTSANATNEALFWSGDGTTTLTFRYELIMKIFILFNES